MLGFLNDQEKRFPIHSGFLPGEIPDNIRRDKGLLSFRESLEVVCGFPRIP